MFIPDSRVGKAIELFQFEAGSLTGILWDFWWHNSNFLLRKSRWHQNSWTITIRKPDGLSPIKIVVCSKYITLKRYFCPRKSWRFLTPSPLLAVFLLSKIGNFWPHPPPPLRRHSLWTVPYQLGPQWIWDKLGPSGNEWVAKRVQVQLW